MWHFYRRWKHFFWCIRWIIEPTTPLDYFKCIKSWKKPPSALCWAGQILWRKTNFSRFHLKWILTLFLSAPGASRNSSSSLRKNTRPQHTNTSFYDAFSWGKVKPVHSTKSAERYTNYCCADGVCLEWNMKSICQWNGKAGMVGAVGIKHWNYSDCFLIQNTEASAFHITHLWPLERLPPGWFLFMLKLATITIVNVLKVQKGQALLLIRKICV